jgi:hypothetical protein
MEKRFFSVRNMQIVLMLTLVAGVLILIAALLWVYNFTTFAQLKNILSPYCTM